MKISFNDKSLHTTFEYPSESSLVQEAQVEAEGEEDDEEDEEEDEGGSGVNGAVEKPFALLLPRATFVNSVAPDSPRRPDGSSGECLPVQVDSPVGAWAHVHTVTCPRVPLACRPVQLHSKALHGFRQVAGAAFGTGPRGGGALTEGGHGEWGREDAQHWVEVGF